MAKIEDREPKNSSGGYKRLFGNDALGNLISKVQGAVIASGSELERIIRKQVSIIKDLDQFLQLEIIPDGVHVASKNQIKKCATIDCRSTEPDFLILKRRDNSQTCHIVELKDGHAYDTKKAGAERSALHTFSAQCGRVLHCTLHIRICCFNQKHRSAIVAGFKNKISKEEAMTGPEFCELLELDYDAIVKSRQDDPKDNVAYFAKEVLRIPVVREHIDKILEGGG